jgi:hypothetical protein
MTTVEIIRRARTDADEYNLQGIAQAIPVEDWINGSDEVAGRAFAALGLVTALSQAVYEYAFASRILSHIEDREALTDPRPKTLGDLVTPKQLWFIRNLGREIGCNVEQECQSLLKCPLEEISKKAASALIDYLKRKAAEGEQANLHGPF